MRSCALLTVVAAASAQEFTRIPKDLSGLPHGLVVPEIARNAREPGLRHLRGIV